MICRYFPTFPQSLCSSHTSFSLRQICQTHFSLRVFVLATFCLKCLLLDWDYRNYIFKTLLLAGFLLSSAKGNHQRDSRNSKEGRRRLLSIFYFLSTIFNNCPIGYKFYLLPVLRVPFLPNSLVAANPRSSAALIRSMLHSVINCAPSLEP